MPERTIRRHMKLGLLEGEKVGGTWRFSEDNLHAYVSHPMMKSAQTKLKLHVLFDYLNGFSEHTDEMVIIQQLKNLPMREKKALSMFVNQFNHPFYFHLDQKSNVIVVTFKGKKEDALALLHQLDVTSQVTLKS